MMHARRRLKTVTRWACMVVAAVVLAAWVVSQWCWVHLQTKWGDRDIGVGIQCGDVYAAVLTGLPVWRTGWYVGSEDFFAERGMVWTPGWTCNRDVQSGHLPLWAPFLAFTLPAAFLWRSHLKNRRARAGVCPTCGYDRRGLVKDAVCPECGAAKTV